MCWERAEEDDAAREAGEAQAAASDAAQAAGRAQRKALAETFITDDLSSHEVIDILQARACPNFVTEELAFWCARIKAMGGPIIGWRWLESYLHEQIQMRPPRGWRDRHLDEAQFPRVEQRVMHALLLEDAMRKWGRNPGIGERKPRSKATTKRAARKA